VGAFGDKLRKQREQRGIALDAISNTTKISTRMLRAIEEEHFDQLPGGVFNKGFVRAYARQVGLDEEEAITDYLAALRESQIQAQTVPPNFRTQPGKPAPDVPQLDRRTHDPDRDIPPGHNLPKTDLPKADLHKANLHNNDLHNNDLGSNGDLRDALDHQTVPRRSADRRREDRRHQARSTEARSIEAPQTAAEFPLPSDPLQISPPPADASTARVPWGKLAVALLLLTLVLAFWSLFRRGQPTRAAQPAPFSQPSPVLPSPPASASTKPSGSSTSLTVGQALPTGTLTVATTHSPNNPPTLAPSTPLKPSPAAPSLTSSSSHSSITSLDSDHAPLNHDLPKNDLPENDLSKNDLPRNDLTKNDLPANGSPNNDLPGDNPPPAKSPAHASIANAPPTFTLLIRAAETSWISVTADGQPLLRETLIAPAHTSIRASREIVVRAGNASAISFLLNGKEIPASGNEGEVRTYTFDSTGLKDSTAAQTPAPAH
jgi:hypothetical protein